MIPIIITCYNRLDTLEKTLDSLFKCDGSQDRKILAYLDGGKDKEDWNKVYKIYEYLNSRGINIRPRMIDNVGLRKNSLFAINESLREHDKIIFIQDDMEFSRDFLTYMDWALNEFEDRKDIMFVSGYSHIYYPKCYLSPLIADGLGIWKKKSNINLMRNYNPEPVEYDFFANYTTPAFASYLKDIVTGKSDAFMMLLAYQMFIRKARCLHPSGNKVRYMVRNSTNCKEKDKKRLNQLLFTGFNRELDESNTAYNYIKETKNYKWGILKRITRYINQKFT